jgi:hypothetical protein
MPRVLTGSIVSEMSGQRPPHSDQIDLATNSATAKPSPKRLAIASMSTLAR